MSAALVGTPQFQSIFGTGAFATAGTITLLCAHAGVPVGAGAMANVGLPMAEVLQNFAENSTLVSNALAAPIANFQNLLLNAAPGAAPPAGNLLTLSGTPGANLTLTTGVDTPTTGFSGHGATATQAGAVFLAPAGSNTLGLSNTLNSGDVLLATGAAAGNSTLNFTAVTPVIGNPATAPGVTMTGVNAAIITNLDPGGAGFSGAITGLTAATVAAGSVGPVTLGLAGVGLSTALTTVTINASADFTAFMTPGALAAAPTGVINVNGGVGTALAPVIVDLDSGGATAGYAAFTINSAGPGGATTNDLVLDVGATATTNTATITVAGAEFLTLSGTALNIDVLHTFTGNAATPGPDTGGLNVTFTNADGAGNVAVTGGSGVNTFTFDETLAGAASFTAASTVNGGSGATNTLDIQADTGAILLAGVGAGITGIATIEHSTDLLGQTGNLTADLSQMGSALTFDLGGTYGVVPGTATVTVSNITNAQTVEFSGTGGFVTLDHAAPVATDVIQIEMDGTGPGPVTVDQLTVAAGIASVNISSIGSASDNVIFDISPLANNINISGGTHLTLGSDTAATGYQVLNGVINAGTDTGGVHVSLGAVGFGGGTFAAQTFTAGTGTNEANVFNNISDVIDFSKGGTDTVQFSGGTEVGAFSIANNLPLLSFIYNQVVGFTNANGNVNINTAAIPTSYTDTGLAVVGGDPTAVSNFTGASQVLTGPGQHFNFIDFATPANFAGDTPQSAFNAAIGANTIGVAAAANPFLFSLYDTATSQAILGTVTETGGTIATGDAVNVVGLLHMSQTDYTANGGATFASHVHFV